MSLTIMTCTPLLRPAREKIKTKNKKKEVFSYDTELYASY